MKKIKLANILYTIFLVTMLALVGCQSNKSVPQSKKEESSITTTKDTQQSPKIQKLRVGYPGVGKNSSGDILGVAIQNGYIGKELEKIGVEVEFINFPGAGPAINEALASDSLEIGVYGDTPAIIAKANGIDTVLIGGGNKATDAGLLVPNDSNIKSVKDLKGKKVATMKGAYMHRTLVEMLNANGLSEKDIEFLNMNQAESEAALLGSKVDAIVAPNTSFAKILTKNQAKLILSCKDNINWSGSNIVIANGKLIRENPQVVESFLKGYNEAKKYIFANPEKAKEIWSNSGNPKEVYDYLYPNEKFGDTFTVELEDDFINKLNYTKQFLIDNKLIKEDFDIDSWADKSIYEKIEK